LHLVSAYATERGLVLAQRAAGEKRGELAVLPELLDGLDLRGCLVSLDALACRPEIAGQVVGRGGDYLITLKANRRKAHAEVRDWFAANGDFPPSGRRARRRAGDGQGPARGRAGPVELIRGGRQGPALGGRGVIPPPRPLSTPPEGSFRVQQDGIARPAMEAALAEGAEAVTRRGKAKRRQS
jgi:hypothetical protein